MGDSPKNNKDLFERFFDKTLSKEDRKELNEKVRQDKTVAKDLAFEVALKKVLQEKRESELRGYLPEKEEKISRRPMVFYIKRFAAVAVVLIGLFVLFQQLQNNNRVRQVTESELVKLQVEFAEQGPSLGPGDWRVHLGKEEFAQALAAMEAKRATYANPCTEDASLHYYGARLWLFYAQEEETAVTWLACILENPKFVRDFPDAPAYGFYAYSLLGNTESAHQILEKYPAIKSQYPHLFND